MEPNSKNKEFLRENVKKIIRKKPKKLGRFVIVDDLSSAKTTQPPPPSSPIVPSVISSKQPSLLTVPSVISSKQPSLLTVPSVTSKQPSLPIVPSVISSKPPSLPTAPSVTSKQPSLPIVPSVISSKPKIAPLSVPSLKVPSRPKNIPFIEGISSSIKSENTFVEDQKFDVIDMDSFQQITSINSSSEDYEYTNANTIYNPDLNTNFDDIDTIIDKTKPCIIHNMCYKINFDIIKPYLMFYLFKYPKSDRSSNDMLVFPFENYKNKPDNNVLKQSSQLNGKIFSREYRPHISKEPRGYIFNKPLNLIFILYEYDHKQSISVNKLERKTQFWWTLIDEIVNHKKVTNFPINNSVYNTFIDNPSLLYLYNRGEIIEIPSVGYHGTYYEIMKNIVKTGLRNSTLNPMMGPYYYFGTFRKAVRYAGWTSTYKPRMMDGKFIAEKDGLYEKGGLIRFAMFLGKMKAFLNHKSDPLDKSSRYFNRIKDSSKKFYEDMVLRLHDHDGKWATEGIYDSVYIGKATLDNGKLFIKNPEFVVKSSNQFEMISYHQLDKNTLVVDKSKDEFRWDPNYNNYNIY